MTELAAEQIAEKLAAPFPPAAIHWRLGPGNRVALAYLDARNVMERLDEVVGIDGWSDSYEYDQRTCVCSLSLNIAGQWVSKSDGAGATDIEGEKGQISDALKRAAVKFGIGRYLYALPTTFVETDVTTGKNGKEYHKIKPAEYKKLEGQLAKLTSNIEWGDRADQNAFRLLTQMAEKFEASQLADFLNGHMGMVKNLPVAQQKELREQVNRMKEKEMT